MIRQVVGIDLGTSNIAVARFVPTGNSLELVPIAQRISPSEVAERELLPSFLYLPGSYELPAGATSLPWEPNRTYLVGEFARFQGGRVPGRCVVSAKSWLAHRSVDPSLPSLPWERVSDVEPISAVGAITRYLEHIVESWNFSFPDDSLQASEVILTIPASFDDLARKFMAGAAASVGLPVRLLEEPQAAFYAWLWQERRSWKKLLKPEDVILVCDIGGGTSDFTLIRYDGSKLERVAVGDHLMLGGDNVDLGLAYLIEQRLGEKLDGLQWGVLVQQCRASKELLLGESALESVTVTVPGSGSRLMSCALSAEMKREEVLSLALNGFFPKLSYEDVLLKTKRRGLKELGLPFESDPAITRHLSRFLHAHSDYFPTKILFNGGACATPLVRSQVVQTVDGWRKELGLQVELSELSAKDTHLAVARGAAWYGQQRQSGGLLVEGGTARSYYLGLASKEAMCVVPASAREGQAVKLKEPRLFLKVGQEAVFPLYSSSRRPKDKAGDLIAFQDLSPLPLLQTRVELRNSLEKEIEVGLEAEVTPVGTLDLQCYSQKGDRFRLQFSVRDGAIGSASSDLARPEVIEARELVLKAFKQKPKELRTALVRPRSLAQALESVLGCLRDTWSPVVLRTLWDSFWSMESRRGVDKEYEAAWLNGIGFCLRPGLGMPLDDWRMVQVEKLLRAWMQFPRDDGVTAQFFICFRRLAAGLSTAAQLDLWQQVHPSFIPGRKHIKTRNKGLPGKEVIKEMLRLAVSLERIPVEEKIALAQVILSNYEGARDDLWLLTRLLARRPLDKKAVANVIPARAMEPMLEKIGSFPSQGDSFSRLALVNMAARCGDSKRDLDDELFTAVEEALIGEQAPTHLLMVLRGEALPTSEESEALFGDSLPIGLRLA